MIRVLKLFAIDEDPNVSKAVAYAAGMIGEKGVRILEHLATDNDPK